MSGAFASRLYAVEYFGCENSSMTCTVCPWNFPCVKGWARVLTAAADTAGGRSLIQSVVWICD